MAEYEDFEEAWWIKLLVTGLVLLSSGSIIGIIYVVYKVFKGIYHLLDKLIDKI